MQKIGLDRLLIQALRSVEDSADCCADPHRRLSACLRRAYQVAMDGHLLDIQVKLDREGFDSYFIKKPCPCEEE